MNSDKTILLNSDYSFLGFVPWERAICMLVKGKVEVLKYTSKVVKNFEGTISMKIPAIMKLVKFIRTLFRTKVPFSKKNVLVRDNFQCAYCGVTSKNLTIDHIVPKSRGGQSNFENTVASCKPCNAKKGNKLPSEVGMYLNVRPHQPTINEFIAKRVSSKMMDDIMDVINS